MGSSRSCTAKVLDLKEFDTAKVEDMSYMFHKANALELDLSMFDFQDDVNVEHMLTKCKSTVIYLKNQKYIDYLYNNDGAVPKSDITQKCRVKSK